VEYDESSVLADPLLERLAAARLELTDAGRLAARFLARSLVAVT
jgi:hypothetical protein